MIERDSDLFPPKSKKICPGVIPNSVWGTMQAKKIYAQPFQTGNPSRTWIRTFPNWPDTAQNILHNLHGQHEATYAEDCTYHLSLPLLILVLVLVQVLLLLLLVHQGKLSRNPVPPSATRSFSTRSGTSRLESCLDRRNPPGTSLEPCPEPAPKPSPNPVPEHCPGTCPEPPPRKPILAKNPIAKAVGEKH